MDAKKWKTLKSFTPRGARLFFTGGTYNIGENTRKRVRRAALNQKGRKRLSGGAFK